MTDVLVSVVIPIHNRVDAARHAISSVLAQTVRAIEVLVVDDHSTDATPQMLAALQDSRIQTFRHARNLGGGASRNTGIVAASGTYLAFLDSDDWWAPEKLAQNLRVAQRLHGRWQLFNQQRVLTEAGARTSHYPQGLVRRHVSEFLFVERGPMQTSALMLPTSLAKEVLFDPELPRLQDWDFHLRLGALGTRFYSQSDVLTHRDARPDPRRISSQVDPAWLLAWIAARRELVTRRGELGFLANKVAPEAIACGDRLAAARCLLPGLALGAVAPRQATIELARLCLPSRVFTWTRRARGARTSQQEER